jgi:hypothetical protein
LAASYPVPASSAVQIPLTQLVDALHGMPQPPQLFWSVVVSTHAVGLIVGQAVNPAVVHVPPQFVPSHVAMPPVGVGQAAQRVPHEPVEPLFMHVPLQSCMPVGHAQLDV